MILRLLSPLPSGPQRYRPGAFPDEPCAVDEAHDLCERFARSRLGEHVALARFVPPDRRTLLFAVCTFAGCADDIVDEPEWSGQREAALDAWEDGLRRAYFGEADHPVFVALADAADRFALPAAPLRDLLVACRMELAPPAFVTWEALRLYLRHAAEPLGELLLHVLGVHEPARVRFAGEAAIGLYLSHLLGEVGADAARGRVYLPQEDLAHFGVSTADLVGEPRRAVRDLLAFQALRARTHLLRGRPLIEQLPAGAAQAIAQLVRRGRDRLLTLERAAEEQPAEQAACASF